MQAEMAAVNLIQTTAKRLIGKAAEQI